MKRLLIFLIIGLLFAIGGVIIGVTSHQVTYQTVSKQVVAHFLADDGASSSHTAFLQIEKDSNLYIINENDFSPALTSSSFGDGDTISFIYRSVDANNIDVKAQNTSTHLQGKAYIMEQLSIVDSSGNAKVYSTSEYKKNPQGFYQNNWLLGIPLLVFGLILAGLGVGMHVLGRRNKAVLNNAPAMGILAESEANAYQMPLGQNNAPTVEMGMLPSLQANSNQQSYENSIPYPQYPQQTSQFPLPGQFQSWPGQANPAQAATAYSQPLQYPQQAEQFPVPGQFQSWPGQANPAQAAAAYSQPLQYQQQPGPEYQQQASQFPLSGQSWSGQGNPAQAAYSQPLQYQQQPGPEYQQQASQFPLPGQSWPGQANPAQAAHSQPPQYQQQPSPEYPQQDGLYEPTQRGNQ